MLLLLNQSKEFPPNFPLTLNWNLQILHPWLGNQHEPSPIVFRLVMVSQDLYINILVFWGFFFKFLLPTIYGLSCYLLIFLKYRFTALIELFLLNSTVEDIFSTPIFCQLDWHKNPTVDCLNHKCRVFLNKTVYRECQCLKFSFAC